MIRTVDLVIAGGGSGALAAAAAALQRGRHVLVVLRSGDARVGRRLRRCLRQAPGAEAGLVTVMAGAEVVCVDGVDRVEAVVIRHARTGRLWGVNASAFLSCDGRRGYRAPARGVHVPPHAQVPGPGA